MGRAEESAKGEEISYNCQFRLQTAAIHFTRNACFAAPYHSHEIHLMSITKPAPNYWKKLTTFFSGSRV